MLPHHITDIINKLLGIVSGKDYPDAYADTDTDADIEAVPDLSKNKNQVETLLIGPVECLNCGASWNAMCYQSTVTMLECPECGTQQSKPLF